MKTKALVLAVFSVGVLVVAAAGKTPVVKSVAPVITITGAGKQISIIPGRLEAGKAAATLASGKTASLLASAKSTLIPGQVVFFGPTGGARTSSTAADATAADAVVVSPLAATIEQQVFRGDLIRATPGASGLTLGSAGTAGGFIFGANGFPVPVTAASPGAAGTPTIGSNGFPVVGSAGATQTIDTNGFPTGTGAAFAQTGLTTTGGATSATALPTTAAPVTRGGASAATFGGSAAPATASTASSGMTATAAGASPR